MQHIALRGIGCARNVNVTRKSGELFDSSDIREKERGGETTRRIITRYYNRFDTRATTLLHVTDAESLSCTCYKTGSFVHRPSSLSPSRSQHTRTPAGFYRASQMNRMPCLTSRREKERERKRPARNWIYRCKIWFDSFSLKTSSAG